jgi:hypothetical protein
MSKVLSVILLFGSLSLFVDVEVSSGDLPDKKEEVQVDTIQAHATGFYQPSMGNEKPVNISMFVSYRVPTTTVAAKPSGAIIPDGPMVPKPRMVKPATVETMTTKATDFKPRTAIKHLESVSWSREHVYVLRNLNADELRTKMEGIGFANLKGLTRNELRMVYAAWRYDLFFGDVHSKTGLPKSVIFSYFCFESLSQGVESTLFRVHGNPGGIKYRGKGKKALAMDDCGGKPCAFAKMERYNEIVDTWVDVFEKTRYSDCTGTPAEICKCLQESGYHTSRNWRGRAALARRYWEFVRKFPRV